MSVRKVTYITFGVICLLFFSVVLIFQIYFKDNAKFVNGTITEFRNNANIVDKVYLDWWNASIKKISSQGVKDIYEIRNTYENLNIVIGESDVLNEIILNDIIIDGKPMYEYEYELINSKDGKRIFKIPISELDKNNTNKLTKVISIYNRYDNVFYNVEIDSFEFRFNFSKDSDFLYLNFENYISNFYDKEFKIESNYYDDSGENFIYNFGHLNKSVKIPLVNTVDVQTDASIKDMFFKENTSFTIYNRFSIPVMTFSVSNSGDLKIKKTYSLSNVYESELKNQVFVFDSKEDNIFRVEKRENGTVDIINLIDNYKVYFDQNLMSTYKVYEENQEHLNDEELINFKMYRDLRDGNYIFSPSKTFNTYKFYDVNQNKFLSYDVDTNSFVLKEYASNFTLTKDNRIFDISNRVFIKKNKSQEKEYSYVGDRDLENGDVFKFNDMSYTIFKKVSYEDITNEILTSNYIQVMFKNKETGEFLSVNSGSGEAVNGTLHNDFYLDNYFDYNKATKDLNKFIFEIRPSNDDFTTFNLYSEFMGTSVNTDYGFLNNKLIFDKNKDNKVRFVIEKSGGQDNEFKIKDDYGSYLSFQDSDDFARVTSSGFMKKFFNSADNFDVFEIYMIDFGSLENINSGCYISLSSKGVGDKHFLDKISIENKVIDSKNLDEYLVFKNKEFLFLNGDSLLNDMVATTDFYNIKGIQNSLISTKNKVDYGYRFRILDEIYGVS